MSIVVGMATQEDARRLIEVQDSGFCEDYDTYRECPSYQETKENMLDMINHAIVYKVAVDGEIVGDAIVRNRGNGSYYLRTLAIIPRFQSLGVGTTAIGLIEESFSDAETWSLITPKGSFRNRHFYEKLGYVSEGEENRSDRLTLIHYRKERHSTHREVR